MPSRSEPAKSAARHRSPRPSAEAARREAELRMRLALEAAAIGVWEYDIASETLTWDKRVREVAEVGDDVTPTWADHFLPSLHPDDRDPVATAFETLAADGEGGLLSLECRIVGRRTRRVTWAALEGRCLSAAGGGLRFIGTARDITEQRRQAEDLRQMNESLERRVSEAIAERQLWADMFESSDDPVAAVDADLRVIAMNGAYGKVCERLFGITLKRGDSLAEALAHMPDARDVAVILWRRALAGEVIEIPRSGEADPAGAFYDVKMCPLRDRTGATIGAYQYSRNVTPRVRAQQRLREAETALRRAQKMEALGQLTGGVAHDFNNLLQVIGGNLQLVLNDVAGVEKAERRVHNALDAVTRGSRLAAQLLAFGRRQPLEPKVFNIGRFLQGMDDMLRRALGEAVELETVVSGGLWNTLIDPGQLENAVLNLAINARDAMEGQGRLTLEAGNAYLDDAYARAHDDVRPGQYVMVAITDTGCGMTREVMERVFEPFYSTKPEGKGTGLGLSMVYGLIKQSGGHIKIYSEVGEGTTIKLYLPRSLQTEDVLPRIDDAPAKGGDETILVVEDDDQVRETVVALLGDLGYRVLKARDAASALSVVESGVAIDLLFTDVVMPGAMRSPELVRLARGRLPSVAVLFTSGYTENAIVHGGRLDAGVELLSKPYSREALARKIRHVLRNQAQANAARDARAAPAPAAGSRRAAPAPSRGLNVLLVEDDDLVRDTTAEMLTGLGYAVAQARDAETALLTLKTGPVDVMVTDRGLPGLSGDDLALRALALHPGLKVVFATGEAAALPDPALPNAIFVIKPYATPDLDRALTRAMTLGEPPDPASVSPSSAA